MLDREHVVALAAANPEWFGLISAPEHGWCTAALLGRGESFEAWTLTTSVLPSDGSAAPSPRTVVLRTPHRGVDRLPRPMAEEFEALRLAPPGVGPAPIACQDHDRRRADGSVLPAHVVLEWVPGQVRDAGGWDDETLAAHARVLARLHERTWPTPGEVRTADTNPPARVSASRAVEASLGWWAENGAGVLDLPQIADLVERVRHAVAAPEVEAAFDALERYSLLHGDPVVSNILLTSRGPRYIDWEWACIGDPARDLAFIGGRVWAHPWYLSLDDARVDRFLRVYLEASGGPAREADFDALRRRREAWLLTETLAVAIYLTWLEHDPTQAATDENRRTRVDLGTRLAAELPAP